MEKSEDFQKIIDDFVKDLLISFPEYEDKFSVIDYDEYYCHCKKVQRQLQKDNLEILTVDLVFCLQRR